MMLVEIFKENNSFPVGTQFVYDKATNMFVSAERVEDISDNYYSIMTRRYSFSPSFYEINKNIFNQVKLEDNEKNKVAESAQGAQAESKSENIQIDNKSHRRGYYIAGPWIEGDKPKEVEKGTPESKSKRSRMAERRRVQPILEKNKGDRKESKRANEVAKIDERLQELAQSILDVKEALDKLEK
jgi:hypothetical protein